ncbi:MAG: MBL fold metallo-hydrolase [Actinomycetota bacterium]
MTPTIIVTHGHVDHFGSAAFLRDALKVPIIAHPADAHRCFRARRPGRGRDAARRLRDRRADSVHARAHAWLDIGADRHGRAHRSGSDRRIVPRRDPPQTC